MSLDMDRKAFYMSSGEKDKRFMVDRIAALRSILLYGKLQKTNFWHLKISHDIKNKAYSEGYLRVPHVTRHSN